LVTTGEGTKKTYKYTNASQASSYRPRKVLLIPPAQDDESSQVYVIQYFS